MGGGGGDTNVTNTGLGDDQYQTLADNQVGISGQITDARDDATARYDNFDTRFDGIDSSVAGVGSNLTAGFTNIQDLMDQYNTGMNTQFDTVNTGIGTNNTAIGANATSLNNLSTDVSGGFNDMSGRFDTVDTGQANIQGAVDQGFVDQAQGFADAQADRTAQFDAANTAMNTGFETTDAAVQEGFGEAATQLTNTQANVLDGQGQLQTNLDTMSDTADTYAAQSLENQAALQQGQDGFVTSFDNYTERYGEDQELAQQSRADLATAQANQTDRLREDMGAYAQAAATGQQGLATQLGDVATGVDNQFTQLGADVQGGFVDTQNASLQSAGSVQEAIAANAAATQDQSANILSQLDAGQVTQARDFAKIASAQTDLDANMRSDFNQLGSAFDDNGQLIKSSIDDQGNTITRAMDAQGNLLLRTFDVQGTEIGGGMVNINQRLNELNKLQNMQGGNASMGNLSPAMSAAVPSTGFASPFATTGTPKPNMERPPNPFAGTIPVKNTSTYPVSQPINPNTFTR